MGGKMELGGSLQVVGDEERENGKEREREREREKYRSKRGKECVMRVEAVQIFLGRAEPHAATGVHGRGFQ